jgi:hypothetical protein
MEDILTDLRSIMGISSSSYSDSSEESLSSSDELVSVGVEGDLEDFNWSSERNLSDLVTKALEAWLVPAYWPSVGFGTFRGRPLLEDTLEDGREAKATRKVNK